MMFKRKREREQYRLAVRNLQDQVESLHAQLVAACTEADLRYAVMKQERDYWRDRRYAGMQRDRDYWREQAGGNEL